MQQAFLRNPCIPFLWKKQQKTMGVWDKTVPMRTPFYISAVIWLCWKKGFFSPLCLPRTSTMSSCQVSGIQDGQDYWPREYVPLSQILRSGGSWWAYSLVYVCEGSNFHGTNAIITVPLIPLLPFSPPVSQFLPPQDFKHTSLWYHSIDTLTVAAELSLSAEWKNVIPGSFFLRI